MTICLPVFTLARALLALCDDVLDEHEGHEDD